MARREALLKLHKRLLSRRDSLRRLLVGELEDLKSHRSNSAGDAFDAAFDSGRDEVTSQLVEIETHELERLERAIRKIEHGTYGLCEGCQKRIPLARLNAMPYSVTCIECQREMESSGDGRGNLSRGDWSRVFDRGADPGERGVNLSDLEIESRGGR